MPKMKTHSGAKKRFKLTATGKVRGRHAFSSHILEKKSPKRKRGFRKPVDDLRARRPARQEAAGGRASDPRQALRPRAQEAPRDARADQGLPRRGELELQARQGSGHEGRLLRLPRPAQPQARLPPPVDHAHQRRRAPERHDATARSCTASSWPASSSTARCWPTSPCATPRPSADLPSRPRGVGRLTSCSRHAPASRAPPPHGRRPFCSNAPDDHQPPQRSSSRRSAGSRRRWRDELRAFVAEGEDLLAAADAAGWPRARYVAAGAGLAGVEVAPSCSRASRAWARARARSRVYEQRWARAGRAAVRRRCGASATRATSARCCAPRWRSAPRSVALGPGSADPFGPKAVRASMGAIFPVPVARVRERRASCPAPRGRARRAREGEPLHGTAATARRRSSSAPSARACRRRCVAACDAVAHIPIAARVAERRDGRDVALYELQLGSRPR